MVEAVGNVSVSVDPTKRIKSQRNPLVIKFQASDSISLRQIERELTPAEARRPLRVTGTVTEFKEPRGKASGTITVAAQVFGEERAVRAKFAREDRDTILDAISRKAEVELAVSGELIDKGGHLTLEMAHDFSIIRRKLLT
jgi:hypothetical protein